MVINHNQKDVTNNVNYWSILGDDRGDDNDIDDIEDEPSTPVDLSKKEVIQKKQKKKKGVTTQQQ